MLLIAEVLKPQGIKGEVKVRNFLDGYADLARIKEIIINGKPAAVEKMRGDGQFAYVKIKGVDDRNAAEALRGASVYVDNSNRPPLAEGRYYVADIIGCKVETEGGDELGFVKEILQHGSADVYIVAGRKPFMFALAGNVVTSFDITNKTITVDPSELKKVAVYED